MDQFVCVRLVQANSIDLSLFQFDFDLTFAAFFMNADKTVYGRFGSRSDRKDAMKDMTMEGFRKALAAALELHKGFPANKAAFEGKRGPAPRYPIPEEYPSLKGDTARGWTMKAKSSRAACIAIKSVKRNERFSRRRETDPG